MGFLIEITRLPLNFDAITASNVSVADPIRRDPEKGGVNHGEKRHEMIEWGVGRCGSRPKLRLHPQVLIAIVNIMDQLLVAGDMESGCGLEMGDVDSFHCLLPVSDHF